MGVRCDDSRGAHTLQKYSLHQTSYNDGFTLPLYVPAAGRLEQLVSR